MIASSSKNAVTASLRSFLRAEKYASGAVCRRAGPSCIRYASTTQASKPIVFQHSRNGNSQSQDSNVIRFRIVRGVHLSECNLKMRECLNKGRTRLVLKIAAQMKENGIEPDLETYLNILTAFASDRNPGLAWATLKDMEILDVEPDVACFNQVLQAFKQSGSMQFESVLKEMTSRGLQPNMQTYTTIVEYYAAGDNVEMALSKLSEMQERGFTPSIHALKPVIESLAHFGHVQLALDVVDAYMEKSGRHLPGSTWLKLLIASADSLNAEGVLQTWSKVVNEYQITPDEGLCEKVLDTAARHGLPALASEVFQQLEIMGVHFQDYHFVPMIEAFVRNNQLKEAFEAINLMRQSKIDPTIDALFSLREKIQRDPDAIDSAFGVLEDMHKAGLPVDPASVNALIYSTNWSRDLQRAIGIYKSMSSLDIKPNVETFETLLIVCRNVKHGELAERLFSEMREAGFKPSAKCYDLLIITIMWQNDYENAFFFLETMKEEGHKPGAMVYAQIVKKCVIAGDSRYKLALEEMKQMGYKVPQSLKDFVANGGARREGQGGKADYDE